MVLFASETKEEESGMKGGSDIGEISKLSYWWSILERLYMSKFFA